jgi:hypothetical protein
MTETPADMLCRRGASYHGAARHFGTYGGCGSVMCSQYSLRDRINFTGD